MKLILKDIQTCIRESTSANVAEPDHVVAEVFDDEEDAFIEDGCVGIKLGHLVVEFPLAELVGALEAFVAKRAAIARMRGAR